MPDSAVQPEPFVFLNTVVTFPLTFADGSDGLSVVDSRASRGDSPPLHVHTTEDEVFHVVEGELRLRIGDEELRAVAGDTILAPKGVPHTYRVESETGRWLAVTARGDFERFVRAVSRRAEDAELPQPSGPPTPDQVEALASAARDHGIELVGPPLD